MATVDGRTVDQDQAQTARELEIELDPVLEFLLADPEAAEQEEDDFDPRADLYAIQ